MKDFLDAVKANMWSALFAAILGWSIGLNIKQYRDSLNDKEFTSDVIDLLNCSNKAKWALFDYTDESLKYFIKDSIIVSEEFKMKGDSVIVLLQQSVEDMDKFNKKYK